MKENEVSTKALKKGAVSDMTTGSPMKLILSFAVPLLGGMLFQQFYSLVDTLIVGRFLGVDALAGVGSTGSINFMIIGFCMGVANGFAIPISQRFGAKDYDGVKSYYHHGAILTALFAVVMTVVVCLLSKAILTAMHTPENIFDYAFSYIFTIFLGIPVIYLYNFTSSAIRALGDSKAPVIFLVIASGINIALDLVFILCFGMGVIGAALATVISQAVSGILCVIYIKRRVPYLHVEKRHKKKRKGYFKVLLSAGLPMGLQYSITAIGSVILQTAVNSLGSVIVAANTAAIRVTVFFSCPFDALGATMTTYGGQNVGANKGERLNQGMKDAGILGIIYSVIAFLILFFLGRQLTGLFIESGVTNRAEVMEYGWIYLSINSAFYILLAFVNIVRFLIQGMGFSGLAVLAGVMEMIGRAAVAFIAVPIFGYPGACFASPVAWILADIFLFIAYFHCRKKVLARSAPSAA